MLGAEVAMKVRVVVETGPSAGRGRVGRATLLVGSAPESELRLAGDPAVGAHHAQLDAQPPSVLSRKRRRMATMAGVVALLAVTAPADLAAVPWGVYVRNLGPEWSRVEVRSGHAASPDSLTGDLLYDGPVQAGQVLALQSPLSCVSWRHTYGLLRSVSFSTWTAQCQRRSRPPYLSIEIRSDGP
jgi:hypothetical protein